MTAVTSAGKESAVRATGAHVVLGRGDDPARVLQAPVDVVADVVAGPALSGLVDALAEGGRLVIAGAVGGPRVEIDVRRLYLRQRRLVGSSLYTSAHFTRLVAEARAGTFRPVVAGTYPLAAIHRAQADFAAKNFVGKLALLPPAGAG